jgi:O-antigen/teichoic acid export membrane protein
VVLVVAVLSAGGTSVAGPFIWLWGAAALPALVVGALRLQLRIGRGVREWFTSSRHLGHPVTGQFLAETGTMQVANLLIAVVAGLGGAASVRVAVSVFAPVSVLLAGLSNLLLPRLTRRAITGGPSRRLVAKVTALTVSASLVYLLLVRLLPDSTGRALFGSSWSPSTPLLLGYGVFIVSTALVVAPARALLGAGYARVGFTVALRQLPVVLLAPAAGYLLWGTAGIGWGFATAGAVSVLLWAQQYAQHSRAEEGTT